MLRFQSRRAGARTRHARLLVRTSAARAGRRARPAPAPGAPAARPQPAPPRSRPAGGRARARPAPLPRSQALARATCAAADTGRAANILLRGWRRGYAWPAGGAHRPPEPVPSRSRVGRTSAPARARNRCGRAAGGQPGVAAARSVRPGLAGQEPAHGRGPRRPPERRGARGGLRAGRRGRALCRAAGEAAQRVQAQRQLLLLPRGARAARAGRRPARQGPCARRAAPLALTGPGLRPGSGCLLTRSWRWRLEEPAQASAAAAPCAAGAARRARKQARTCHGRRPVRRASVRGGRMRAAARGRGGGRARARGPARSGVVQRAGQPGGRQWVPPRGRQRRQQPVRDVHRGAAAVCAAAAAQGVRICRSSGAECGRHRRRVAGLERQRQRARGGPHFVLPATGTGRSGGQLVPKHPLSWHRERQMPLRSHALGRSRRCRACPRSPLQAPLGHNRLAPIRRAMPLWQPPDAAAEATPAGSHDMASRRTWSPRSASGGRPSGASAGSRAPCPAGPPPAAAPHARSGSGAPGAAPGPAAGHAQSRSRRAHRRAARQPGVGAGGARQGAAASRAPSATSRCSARAARRAAHERCEDRPREAGGLLARAVSRPNSRVRLQGRAPRCWLAAGRAGLPAAAAPAAAGPSPAAGSGRRTGRRRAQGAAARLRRCLVAARGALWRGGACGRTHRPTARPASPAGPPCGPARRRARPARG